MGDYHTLLCPEGYYCEQSSSKEVCPAGAYCPNGTTFPSYCFYPGAYCPEGSVNISICPQGYYCPYPNKKITCPKGYFCKEGYMAPLKCAWLGQCPEGSISSEVGVRGVLFTLFLGSSLLALYSLLNFLVKTRQRRYSRGLESKIKESNLVSALLSAILGENLDAFSFKGFARKDNPVTIGFYDLRMELVDGRRVLNSVTGEFRNSTLSAVMGPSGSGKSTFLNVLTGKATYGKMSGHVYLNGHRARLSDYRRQIGFVPQDDICYGNLTVRENLTFNARLRLPKGTSEPSVTALVDDVLKILGLTHIQHSVIGSVERRGISGGQRKRVNIGMELCAYPDVLFLDEPTSGLDSTASLDIVKSLKRIARLGVTVVAVIHQPRYSLFKLFDDVLLLGVGGNTVFMGRSYNCERYFSGLGFEIPPSENPADFYMDVISGNIGRKDHPAFKPEDLSLIWKEKSCENVRRDDALSVDNFSAVQRSVWGSMVMFIMKLVSDDANSSQYTPLPDNLETVMSDESNINPFKNAVELGDEKESLGYNVPDGRESVMLPLHFGILKATFDRFDSNGDGRLDVEDIQRMMRFFGNEITDADIHAMIKALSLENSESLSFKDLAIKIDQVKVRVSETQSPKSFGSGMGQPLLERQRHRFITQLGVMMLRNVIQIIREFRAIMFDFSLLVFSAVIIGSVYGAHWKPQKYLMMIMLTSIQMGMIATMASLRNFGNDRVVFWRESSAGVLISSHFFSKNLTSLFELYVYPLIFTTVIYNFLVPLSSFIDYYQAYLLIHWVNSGMGMLISALMSPQNALLAAVVLPLILGGFFSGVFPPMDSFHSVMQFLSSFSSSRWAVEAIAIHESRAYPHYLSTEFLFATGYKETDAALTMDIIGLVVLGFMYRILTVIALHTSNRDKRQ